MAGVGGGAMGSYGGSVRAVESASGETMLLWGLGQPASHRNNALVRQAAQSLELDACRCCSPPPPWPPPGSRAPSSGTAASSSPSSSSTPSTRGTRAVDLGDPDAASSGAHVVLTDLPDRLKLLRKNVDDSHVAGSAQLRTRSCFSTPCPISGKGEGPFAKPPRCGILD